MYVYAKVIVTQYGPVKHWVHCKLTSHPPPPNYPVSATALDAIDATKIQQCLYLRNAIYENHADSCRCW